jgi:hypothetical protein
VNTAYRLNQERIRLHYARSKNDRPVSAFIIPPPSTTLHQDTGQAAIGEARMSADGTGSSAQPGVSDMATGDGRYDRDCDNAGYERDCMSYGTNSRSPSPADRQDELQSLLMDAKDSVPETIAGDLISYRSQVYNNRHLHGSTTPVYHTLRERTW